MTTVLDIDETCAFLKVPKPTLYKWARAGRIPAFKVGKEWRFDKDRMDEWIGEQIERNVKAGQERSCHE